jgi:type I restriction-modification system DNA methylase subunit
LTGDKALRTLAHLLDLRLLEHQFGKTIDIDNFNYDFSDYGFTEVEEQEHKMKLLQIVRFSKLAESKEVNLPTNMKYLWKDILSIHPKTKNIFLECKGFDITNQSTYKKLITKLNSFDFESIEEDVLGEAYEEVIKDVMIGKTLGQFFTPPKVKKMMVKLIDPQVKEDGTIETIFDPAMGTGGFLINCLRHLITQSKIKNINLDWEFIRQFGVGGREAEPDTYQLAVSNMLISSGQMFDEKLLQKGDTIRDPITNKYDIVLANPPFGIDGLDYNDIEHKLRNEYLPIKSNSAVPLFLQAIIYMLRIGGRCAVVLPEGQELFSKNKALVSVREFLMKTCDLKEVIYLPAGTFTHTSIKTCVFYFIKKRECDDALKIKIKTSKITNKETERLYDFSKTHQTSKVNFYDFNPDNGVKHPLLEVSIEEISNNSYSLNYAEYLKDNVEEEKYEDGIVVKTLGEVCEINQGNSLTKKEIVNGIYDVIGGGKIIGKHNQKNRDGNDFTLTRVGDININYIDKPYYLTDNGFSLKSIQII